MITVLEIDIDSDSTEVSNCVVFMSVICFICCTFITYFNFDLISAALQ